MANNQDKLAEYKDKNILFKIKYAEDKEEEVEIELFYNEAPVTTYNFVKIVEGFDVNGKPKSYKGATFHRIIKDFMIQCGQNLGDFSVYGGKFDDEYKRTPWPVKHSVGCLSMANAGRNTNSCQFFITVAPTPWLDNRHVVFGKVVKGLDKVKEIGNVRTDSNDKPLYPVTITSSTLKNKFI